MENFRLFLENNESDAHASIRKLPSKYRKLVRGYTIKFQNSGTLKGDGEHIGRIQNTPTKSITVAAPWYYPREFALLHEIGHLVWEKYVKGTKYEEQWNKICERTKGKLQQNNEEQFCHAFAACYSLRPPAIFFHKTWMSFIKNLP